MNEIRLLILEEHKAVRNALQVRLESSSSFDVVGAYPNSTDWKRRQPVLFNKIGADVVLLGLKSNRLRPMNSIIEVIDEFKQGGTAVIVLASVADEIERELVLQAGAKRYLLKDINSMELIAEIESLITKPAN